MRLGARGASATSVSSEDAKDVARARLQQLRFQQTVSGSATGAAKVPLGLEATFVSGRSYVEQQMSLPEIVASLRDFLELLAASGKVLVGIDELDKIGSDDAAMQFLNEIKGVFGVRGCYFLVSVSEQAIASFERRGLPFRDAFDSALDEVVQVRPLNLIESSTMLSRRVYNMPAPFKQFCYCLSGGLPRDLIRAARNVVSAQDEGGPTPLGSVVTRVISTDVNGKLAALGIASKQPGCEPLLSSVFGWCLRLEGSQVSAEQILDALGEISSEPFISRAREAGVSGNLDVLRDQLRDLLAYLYYCATLLDIFGGESRPDDYRMFGRIGITGELQRVRATISTSAIVAWQLNSKFREAQMLPFAQMPSWLT